MKDVISSSQKIKVDAPIAQWIERQTLTGVFKILQYLF